MSGHAQPLFGSSSEEAASMVKAEGMKTLPPSLLRHLEPPIGSSSEACMALPWKEGMGWKGKTPLPFTGKVLHQQPQVGEGVKLPLPSWSNGAFQAMRFMAWVPPGSMLGLDGTWQKQVFFMLISAGPDHLYCIICSVQSFVCKVNISLHVSPSQGEMDSPVQFRQEVRRKWESLRGKKSPTQDSCTPNHSCSQ